MSSSRLTDRVPPRGARVWPAAAVLGAAAFLFAMATVSLLNDHFGRISPARQIAVHGDLPFRDFLDPGYFMTELSSAALQRLLGDNLIGEALLTSAFVAGGTVLVFLLARSLSNSSVTALVAAVLALLFLPRAYDYDKVLFYPLGILLCWRYVEKRTAASVWVLAAGLVAGGLFRYDTGVYIGGAAVVAMAVVHAGDWRVLGRRVGLLGAAVTCLALPFLAFLQYSGGIVNAVDQMVTYGRRETARTRITTQPRFAFTDVVSRAHLPPPLDAVLVRWAPQVDEAGRAAAEARHGLLEGRLRGESDERTWAYRISDPSVSSLRALLEDPEVEDTSGIERSRLRLTPEPFWTRAQRAVPILGLRLLPGGWHVANADTFLYYLFRLLPLVAAVVLMLAARSRAVSSAEIARIASLVTVCVALNLFIMREPVGARVGGMAGPAAILSAWIACRIWHTRTAIARRTLKVAVAVVLALTVWSVSASADWKRMLKPEIVRPAHLARVVTMLSASPPSLDALPNSHLAGMVKYLRECTGPEDRILATWFVPELYFFAQRGFAAGIVAVFGEHWSEPRFQARSLKALASESVPIVITRTGDGSFERSYPLLVQYLGAHYRNAGTTDFGDREIGKGGYTVLVRRDRVPTYMHPATSMPCFW